MSKKWDKIISIACIATGIGIMGSLALKTAKNKWLKTIIYDISWISKDKNEIEFSWYDDDDEEQVYNIFVAEQRGIDIKNPKTYVKKYSFTSLMHENGHFTYSIKWDKEWIYFIVTKENYVSNEYEAKINYVPQFNKINLSPRLLLRENKFGDTVIKLNYIPGIDQYKLYHYVGNDTVEETTYNLKERETVLLKVKITENSIGFLSAMISGIEEKRIFLFLSEKVYRQNKWKVTTLIC